MSRDPTEPEGPRGRSLRVDIDTLADRFEAAWQAGEQPRIEDYVGHIPSEESDNTARRFLLELVMIDLEHRWSASAERSDEIVTHEEERPGDTSSAALPDRPCLEDYARCFPALGTLDRLPEEVIVFEYRVRWLWGDRPSHDSYESRFREHSPGLLEELYEVDSEISQGSVPRPRAGGAADEKQSVIDTTQAYDTSLQLKHEKGALQPDNTEFGDYVLLEEIARGGMGVVYKARQKQANRTVALKMILSGQMAGDEEVQRFCSEAQAAANLDHPGIVPVYDVGQVDGRHYFSMGYVDGQSLKQRVADGPLPPREAAELVNAIAEAVAYAHEQGIIHRDLKPANVLVDGNGRPRVTDFGLAKQIQTDAGLTATGQILGTPSYMPPEQAEGNVDAIGPPSDVYSLGAILYELLTGRPPFQAGNAFDTLMQVLKQEPIPPRRLNTKLPRDLETICLKCLDKDAGHRYQTAKEVVEESRRFLDSKPIQARPISSTARVWRWCRRNPVVAGLLAALAVSLLLGIVFSTHFAITAGRRAEQAEEAEQEATDLANEKTKLAEQERSARIEEARQRLLLLQQQALESVRNAWQAFDTGNESGMLIWLADALRTSDQVAHEATDAPGLDEAVKRQIDWQHEVNRMRMASALQHQPLSHVWPGVRAAAFSHDGRLAATGGHHGEVVVYELATGKAVLEWKTKDLADATEQATTEADASSADSIYAVLRIAFSPDDRLLMTVTTKAVQLWDLSTGEGEPFAYDDQIRQACFTGDTTGLACLDDGRLSWWQNGPLVKEVRSDAGRHPLAISPNGRRLVARSPERAHDATKLLVLDAASGDTTATLDVGPDVHRVIFSPDASRLAVLRTLPDASPSLPRLLEVWDVNRNQRLLMWGPGREEAENEVESLGVVKFSPDGACVAAEACDHRAKRYLIRVWSCATGKPIAPPLEHEAAVSAMAFTPDGEVLATAVSVLGDAATHSGYVRMWNVELGTPMGPPWSHKFAPAHVEFDANGCYLLVLGDYSANSEARLWEFGRLRRASRALAANMEDAVVGFASDGQTIIAAARSGGQAAWQTDTLEPVTLPVEAFTLAPGPYMVFVPVTSFRRRTALVPNGHKETRQIPYTVYRSELRMKTVLRMQSEALHESLALLREPIELPVQYACVHAEGKWRVTINKSSPGEVRVWDVTSGQPVTQAMNNNSLGISRAAFAADGRLLLVCTIDGSIRIWDVTTSLPVTRPIRYRSPLHLVDYSADGKWMITETLPPKVETSISTEPRGNKLDNRDATKLASWRVWELFPRLEQPAERLFQIAEAASLSTIDSTRSAVPLGR